MTGGLDRFHNPEAKTVPQLMATAVASWPDKLFLDVDGEQLTFAQTAARANRMARGLGKLGIGPGDRVSAMLDTSMDNVILWLAVTSMGAVMVPMNTAFKGEFLRHQLADSGAKLIVAEGQYADRITALAGDLPELERLLWRGAPPAAKGGLKVDSFVIADSADDSPLGVDAAPGDLAALIYTSGTTGPSKGCMLGQNALLNAGFPMLVSQTVTGRDTLWCALPLFHLAAVSLVFGMLQLGGTFALASRFSVSGFWDEIERTGATAIFALSTMFPLLIDAEETAAEKRCHGKVRAVFGVPFLKEMQDRWKARFGMSHAAPAGYGMTECCPICQYPGGEIPAASTGVAVPYLDVRILVEDDREADPGEPGEIVVRPRIPHVMSQGYWRRPEATAEVWRDLWFHTGDIGRIDAEGYLYFVDRKKDYMRSRGENVSSFEVEGAFRQHPAVADVAVHAVKSALSEDDIKATIVLREGASATEEDILRWSMGQLPYFAVPRYIEFRDDLPRNAVNRVLKYELRAEGVTAKTWDREAAGIKVTR
jgi:crotonobetaine/carnitine-CoA ligase